MPELPEVETIKRGLQGFCLNKKIVRVKSYCDKSLIGPREIAEGRTVEKFRRFGKALVVDLSEGVSLMVHLRMTGQLVWVSSSEEETQQEEPSSISTSKNAVSNVEIIKNLIKNRFAGGHPSDNFTDKLPNKQTRVEIEFEGGGKLFFNDQRKFGFIKILPTDEVLQDKFIASLAPEPWKMEAEDFYQRLQRHKNSPIKAVILDQKVICGLGNIYADEALFYAGILPTRKAGEVSKTEAKLLLKGACEVMEKSINSGGSTMATYVKADGTKGDYLRLFAQVFRREGEPCNRCGTEIIKTRVAGRGTHICPRCQK
ncbi:bifunctional DNA-formamidopyrimidine glycosylase/DNA-(apurinic or apyrimidinic site) lyase [Candidatus Saccharibacteria bacterium]|nr:bifunctional DNA-formamidopyrimidine glycosylase/DNA-(apurinic or apyrimidinic site) lyase [Candidatus Saccharibacteria bacterium]MBR1796384.1 bifunctional DNA-formamidopyrimidine glycosylase/DNA-(apurinic or apyrimidinic site) lyase [Candidatus Saccharibacteria bacterium]